MGKIKALETLNAHKIQTLEILTNENSKDSPTQIE